MKIQYSIFDTLLEPVFVLDVEQKVVYCNEAAALLTGLSVRKITRGLKLTEILHFEKPIEALKNLIQICDAIPYREISFSTTEGSSGKLQITLQPVFDTVGDKNWILFARDVTLEERLQLKYRQELEQKEVVISDLKQAKTQLEHYSKNLENMVAERTTALSSMNQTMSALLDSLGQGFFIFNSDGLVLDVSSKACTLTIETNPKGKNIWDVLKLPADKVDGFKKWMMTIFAEMLPFADLAALGPTHFTHSEGKYISLEYHPLTTVEGKITGIVVVASDITSLIEAQRLAESEKEHAKLIIHMIKRKREILRFIQESQHLMQLVRQQVSVDEGPQDRDSLFRYLHTLKGGAALFSILPMATACHRAEDLLSNLGNQWSKANYIALRATCFEVAESFESFLKETRDILGPGALHDERQIEIAITKLNLLAKKIGCLPGGGPLAQELLLELVMEPVSDFIAPYVEMTESLAFRLQKKIAPLDIQTSGTMVIPEIYSGLFNTFVHIFKNSLDHGIEFPEARVLAGKSPVGQIKVEATILDPKGSPQLLFKISDDGVGIDPAIIRTKRAVTSSESDFETIQHVFDSQFSTRESASEISGRGVGMDAVKHAAQELGGKVWVESKVGQGTTFFIQVPYLTEIKSPPALPGAA